MLFWLQEAEEGTEDTERLVGEVLFELVLGEAPLHVVAERVTPNTRATRSSVKKRPATRPMEDGGVYFITSPGEEDTVACEGTQGLIKNSGAYLSALTAPRKSGWNSGT